MCFSGGGSPSAPPPPPPPIPPPVRNVQGQNLRKSADQRAALAAGGGVQSGTILTGGLGLTSTAATSAKKSLLGN